MTINYYHCQDPMKYRLFATSTFCGSCINIWHFLLKDCTCCTCVWRQIFCKPSHVYLDITHCKDRHVAMFNLHKNTNICIWKKKINARLWDPWFVCRYKKLFSDHWMFSSHLLFWACSLTLHYSLLHLCIKTLNITKFWC